MYRETCKRRIKLLIKSEEIKYILFQRVRENPSREKKNAKKFCSGKGKIERIHINSLILSI